jgi:phenylacetate-CoA ligase
MKQKLYNLTPNFIQNLLISLYNYKAYKVRYGGEYNYFLKKFKQNRNLTREELVTINEKRYREFILKAIDNSAYYKELYKGIENPEDIKNISKLPIVSKEDLRSNIDKVVIRTNEKLGSSKTGGTTGKSLQVYTRRVNQQERFAMLDDFRGRFGYELGKKTAWFSGKTLLTNRDIKKNRFWKTDVFNKVRYYSTFHIKDEYLKYYVEDLIKFQPEYLSGFPSTMYDIAKYGLKHNYDFPSNSVKAIFPTAESVTPDMRKTIETFFKTKMYDQYASSEGAPFIFECKAGNLHLELQSGVFEVLDENDKPTQSGRLVVTSFTTEATPLIRYDIGDSITLEDESKVCSCGNNNPMVKEILGRIDDYVYSPENGKINIVNIANAIKDVRGVIRYQIIQDDLNKLLFKIVIDSSVYNKNEEKRFVNNWKERVGEKMDFKLEYVDVIPNEASGKFRIVKNNVKHLVEG